MKPSKEDIAHFIAFAPDAGEGRAFVFLEVGHITTLLTLLLIPPQKDANNLEEAVAQFYENPDKYSSHPSPNTKVFSMDGKKGLVDPPLYSPPPYAPPSSGGRGSTRHQTHTNVVIEAANVRARDEVCFTFDFSMRTMTDVGLARDAEHAAAGSIDTPYLQYRH
jgi:hypothetical protein